MVQCELCGTETGAPKTIKIEGAELDVCDSCVDLGSEVRQSTQQTTTTKYSTSSTSTPSKPTSSSTSTRSSGRRSSRGEDIFDSLGDLAQDYDERIRNARESRGLSQAELADELNEKRSLINKLERGEMLPNDAVQSKLERYLEIDLSGGGVEETEWESGDSGQSFTLGEMAERKD